MRKLLLSLAILGCIGSAAQAQVIVSVNFTRSFNAAGDLAPTTVAGVEAASNWNNINTGNPNVFGNTSLLDSTGAATTVGFTATGASYVGWSGDSTGDGTLARDALRASSTAQGASTTIEFTGLGSAFTDNGYDVLVYLADPAWFNYLQQTNTMTSAGFATTTYYTAVQNYVDADPDAWVLSTSTSSATYDTGSYLRFSGLTDSSFSLSTVYTTSDGLNNGNDSGIAGIQIVAAIPEPSTYAALAGALALGVVAWRRRRR